VNAHNAELVAIGFLGGLFVAVVVLICLAAFAGRNR
jgi:hypothetical protein